MKLLILGGTGVISRAIVGRALDSGFNVTAVNRGSRTIGFENRIRSIRADRKDAAAFAAALKDERPDVVIDMISFNADDARQTLSLFRDRAAQIVVTSSIAAYSRPYKNLPIREDAESLLPAESDFAYGRNKADMERFLTDEMSASGAAITVIRPSLTFGPGSRNFGMLRQNCNVLQRIKDGLPLVMVGEGVIPWSFTYADDLAQGYILACGNTKTFGKAFHVVNDEMLLWEDLYRVAGELVGREPVLYAIPSALLRECDPAAAHLNIEKVYCSVFSTEKFRAAAPAFRPVWKLRDALAKVIESWERDGLGVDEAKMAQEDRLCACWEAFRRSLLENGRP